MKQLTDYSVTAGQQGVDEAFLFAKAEWLCRTVADRDLESTPLYIVPTSAIPDKFGGAADCLGFTSPSLDLYLQDYIPNYRGRGPCMVVEFPRQGDLLPEDVEHMTLVTVLHELAHILERSSPYKDRTGVEPAKIKFESLVVGRELKKPLRKDVPRHHGHGIEFIRACLHLQHRTRLAGIHIAANSLCAGWLYGLSHADVYARALGDEPFRMIDATFREILKPLPPLAFQERWERDLRV